MLGTILRWTGVYKFYESRLFKQVSRGEVPTHIGIILDGNRRWARSKGYPTLYGHKKGFRKIKELLKWARENKIECLIAYAFSTENWKRPKEEVDYLMDLFREMLKERLNVLHKEKIKIKFIGEIWRFPKDIREGIKKIERESSQYNSFTLIIALSYGGRAEIISTIKKLNPKKIASLNEKNFAKNKRRRTFEKSGF